MTTHLSNRKRQSQEVLNNNFYTKILFIAYLTTVCIPSRKPRQHPPQSNARGSAHAEHSHTAPKALQRQAPNLELPLKMPK